MDALEDRTVPFLAIDTQSKIATTQRHVVPLREPFLGKEFITRV
jgi:hypothetical protein